MRIKKDIIGFCESSHDKLTVQFFSSDENSYCDSGASIFENGTFACRAVSGHFIFPETTMNYL